jgi:glyoxylase-like metal-dependent hydrolase (beta-lactamase superfamily II)
MVLRKRHARALLALLVIAAASWVGVSTFAGKTTPTKWREILPGVFRSSGTPAGYALVDGNKVLLFDAPSGAEAWLDLSRRSIDAVLLTHHHRDTCAAAGLLLAAGVKVKAPRASAEWLTPDGARKYWKEALPLKNSNTAYLVLPAGLEGIEYSLENGQQFSWQGWDLRVLATPGHSHDHVAIAARKAKNGPLIVFAGDAVAEPGKLWSPYTTDWDHWTDAGLAAAAGSLCKVAALKPDVVLPTHGPAITTAATEALTRTADAVAEVGFLKSFERYSKQRVGNPPAYRFLAPEQAGTGGEKPWSRLSEHLYLTGNTYVLASRDNAILVVDPWGKRIAAQIKKLQTERGLGPIERVVFSHAHYDHYDGIYDLPERDKFQVWSLATVAKPIMEPTFYRAPFLDARPVKFDRRFDTGAAPRWREYQFKLRHFPGQSYFTMSMEAVIDGKRCMFTADNFFHVDLYSGTGGWMGLNRSWPDYYAASAQKVLELHPDWILAEHGGAFEFNAEDMRRRVEWARAGGRAADAISPSGNYRQDWDPHRVHVEPILHKARPGSMLSALLVVENPLSHAVELTCGLEGRGLTRDQEWTVQVPAGGTIRREITVRLAEKIPAGRHILPLRVTEGERVDPSDAFLAIDVE